MPKTEIYARAGRAAAWAAVAKWLDMIGSTVTFLVMVRLLGPESFGLFGMALLVLLLPETVLGGALSDSLIQRRDLRPGHVTAAFLLQVGLGLVLSLALLGLAPAFAGMFGHAELKLLIPVMAATLVLLGIGAAPAALMQRELKFGAIASVDAAGTVTAAAVGVTLGLSGLGVWSLVWMEFARRLVRAVGFVVAARWRPTTDVRWADLSDLTHFNLYTLANRLLQELEQVIPRTVVAMTMGAHALGYFNLAWRIFQQGSGVLIAPFNAVALPLASAIQHDRSQLHAALGGATRVAALIAYPAFIGAAAIAPAAIPLLAGKEWTPAVPAIQLMLLMGIRSATASFNGGVLRGSGRPELQLLIVGCGVALTSGLTTVAATWGLTAVVGAMLVRGLVTWGIGAYLVERTVGYPMRHQFLIGWQSLAAAGVMAAAVLSANQFLAPHMTDWVLLPTLVLIGVVVHGAALSVIAPALARRLVGMVAALVRRDRQQFRTLLAGKAA